MSQGLEFITAQAPFSAGPHLQPQYDVIDGLPARAQDRLRKLRERSNDMHAVTVKHAELQEQIALQRDAETALKRLTGHPSEGGFNLPETDNRVVAAQRHLDKMAADLKRLNERSETRAAAWQKASQAKGCRRDMVEKWPTRRHHARRSADRAAEVTQG